MPERPSSRYTRARTWSALYSQHINAGYAWVPYSTTSNSVDVIRCGSPEDVQATMRLLAQRADECDQYYFTLAQYVDPAQHPLHFVTSSDQEPKRPEPPPFLAKARTAVVLARSSEYYHYHLAERNFKLVICGLHDSYLHIPVWETRSNKRFGPRETAVAIASPTFDEARKTSFGHNILLGALLNGDREAIAFIEAEGFPDRTRRRLRLEVGELQSRHAHARPLTFLTEWKREEIGAKISAGLKKHHARKRGG